MSESDMCEFVVLIIFGVLLLCLLYFLIFTLSPDTLPKQCPPRPGKILDSSRPAFALRSLHSFIIRIGGCSEYACPCGVFPHENTCNMCPKCPNMLEYARICLWPVPEYAHVVGDACANLPCTCGKNGVLWGTFCGACVRV